MLTDGRRGARLNALCPYYTMFPLSFPQRHLKPATAGGWVLDPFCGRGTTNLAARVKGLGSIGVDVSTVAAAIARAKFAYASPAEVSSVCDRILRSRPPATAPTGEFWELCYHPKTLADLARLRDALLEDCRGDARILLRAVLLGILHGPENPQTPTYLSNQMPRTYATKPASAVNFWRQRAKRPRYVEVASAVRRRAEYSLQRMPTPVPGEVVQADSRGMNFASLGKPFRWVITSPPYFQMNTYVPDQWLRAWFVGGPATVDYSSNHQLGMGTPDVFTDSLAAVWKGVAEACVPGAHLHVRLGSLPSNPSDPRGILRTSIARSEAPWRIRSLRRAGDAGMGKRQATQFGRKLGRAVEEFDLHATLDG